MFFIKPVGIKYFDSGDIAAPDFETGDFTKDDAWHDLILPMRVPSYAKLVFIRLKGQTTAASGTFLLRPKGSVNDMNVTTFPMRIVDIINTSETSIVPGIDGKIQYYASATTWTVLNLLVSGWFV